MHVILKKFENFIDFQFTQLFIQTKKDLVMKQVMLMDVSKLILFEDNKKIFIIKNVKIVNIESI